MKKYKYLKKTLSHINKQLIGNSSSKIHFLAAFFNHYILKEIGFNSFIKFPKAHFHYESVKLRTRENTLDFWTCLESYEPDLTYFLVKVMAQKKGTFIDVGAYIGRYTVLMAKQEWNVISFEPVKINFEALQSNLKLNNCEQFADLHNVGLGDSSSSLTIYYNKKELSEASLTRNKSHDGSDKIPIVKLDDYMKNFTPEELCVVKIDVEGHEKKVIAGMLEFIKTHQPLLVIEVWEENCQTLVSSLKSMGYKRLHIFWFVESKHAAYMEQMYNLYNNKVLRYEYE